MNKNIINIFSIILIIIAAILLLPCCQVQESFEVQLKIPKTIIQTYYDIKKIPSKVYENIKKYAPEYQHFIYDLNDCKAFLEKEFDPIVVNRYNSLKNISHKEDLFRFCYLYKYGGIFLDIKNELLRPINTIFTNNFIYAVLSRNNNSIYSSVLAGPPNRKLFIEQINHILYTPNMCSSMMLTTHFYNLVSQKLRQYPLVGLNRIDEFEHIYLFKEHCTTRQNKYDNRCYGGYDIYGYCCFINDFNQPIIKSRYLDFPW